MTTIIVRIAAELFGKEEKKSSRTSYSKNQRAVKIHIRKEMKALKSQHKMAGEEERIGLAQFNKDLLGQKCSGKLASSQEEIYQHLAQMYSDPGRELELGECNILLDPPEPEVQFNLSELQLKEVIEVIHKARARSALGPSDTSCKVYKTYPKPLLRLWKILRVFWRKGTIPEQWQVAEGVWIPKEQNSTQLDQFCIISLLCVEANIFFSAISKRLCT
ncbi:hypothetical protein AOLI_G00133720 [Acnodon oligacanthus]